MKEECIVASEPKYVDFFGCVAAWLEGKSGPFDVENLEIINQ